LDEEAEFAKKYVQRAMRKYGLPQGPPWLFPPASLDDVMEKSPAQPGWPPPNHKLRDELAALQEAAPDLQRVARYEQRLWSRFNRAVRRFIELSSHDPEVVSVRSEPARKSDSAAKPEIGK
jgi:hypothetical protein